jgi:hypothetical protein
MAYNAPGDSPGFIKPILLAFIAASILLAGAFFVITTLYSSKTDSATGSSGTRSSAFTEGFMKAFVPIFRGSCVKSGTAALTKNGVDTTADGIDAKIETYCTCATGQFASKLSIPELLKFKFDPSSEPAASKIKNIMQECREEIGQ